MSTAKRSGRRTSVLLAGDIGGTKTLLGLFDPRPVRPRPILIREFATLELADLPAAMRAFVDDGRTGGSSIDAACFGVAGPVLGDTAELTNVHRRIDASSLARTLDIRNITLLNDLQAMACAVPVLEGSELQALQTGSALEGGNIALIAAGTGLGEAVLCNMDGRLIPLPSEGGHADWAARTERDIAVLRELVRRFGRAAVEQVVSGPGLVNIHRATHEGSCPALDGAGNPNLPAAISSAATARHCAGCVEALSIFVDAYGAEAGNLALRAVSTGGLFLGGGIAPQILPALSDGRFMRAFRDKEPFGEMLARIPVKVILNPRAGLLGAAVYGSTR